MIADLAKEKEQARAAANATVAERWGEKIEVFARVAQQGWLDSSIVYREVVNPRQFGAREGDWLSKLMERLAIPDGGSWLSLGCGSGDGEIKASLAGRFASMQALDVADRAIAEARRQAAARGVANIDFGVVDFNRITLPRAAFDVVVMTMSLHHVAALERLMRAVRAALKPGGWFLVNEYVGPARLQYTDPQLAMVRGLLAALPERLRMDSSTGQLKTEYVRLPVDHWLRWDPSEAVRSDQIVPLLHRYFDVVLQLDYGGTLLNPLLEHIVHNFDPRDETAVALIKLLGSFEDQLISQGILPNNFTVMAVQRPTWRSRRQAARRFVKRTEKRGRRLLRPLGTLLRNLGLRQ